MKAGAKIPLDVEKGTAVYSVKGELHLLTIATNKRSRRRHRERARRRRSRARRALLRVQRPARRGTKPGRVSFLPASQLPKIENPRFPGVASRAMARARRHQRLLPALAFGLLALAAELVGRSLTHRIDFGRHVPLAELLAEPTTTPSCSR